MTKPTGALPGWLQRHNECSPLACEIAGKVPPDLDGAFFRLGGAWYYPPKFEDDILLHADGVVSMFRISGGRVTYASRYVETERLTANRAKERMRFGYYRNRFTDDEDVGHLSAGAANTTAFAFAGKLLALKEDSQPYDIDPVTLETRGRFDFDGAIDSVTFTAHPMVDGVTGELVAFGYQARGNYTPDVHIWIFHPDGSKKHEIRIETPCLDMIHDMAITRDHILLPMGGYTTSEETARREGGPMWRWAPDEPARIGVLRRDGDGSDLRWFTGPKSCLLHTFNAWDEGDEVVLDAPFYCGNPFPFLKNADGGEWRAEYGKAYLRRLRFDPGSSRDEWREERLFEEAIADLGDVDPRRIGRRHRYCFGGMEVAGEGARPVAGAGWVMPNALARFDVEARVIDLLRMGSNYAVGEVRFVPRSPDAQEGDGWLLVVATDLAAGRSELVIADAMQLADGPLARALLPFPAAPQVHGNWVPASAMPMLDVL